MRDVLADGNGAALAGGRPATVARPRKTRAARALPSRTALLWGLAGFASGVLFWHVVGFWSLVSTVAFKGRPEARHAIVSEAKPGGALDGVERDSTPAPAARCVDLKLDRGTGRVDAAACDGAVPTIRGPVASRGDLALSRPQMPAPSVAGWATRVEEAAPAGAGAGYGSE